MILKVMSIVYTKCMKKILIGFAITGLDTSKTLDIGELKSKSGAQEYLVSKQDFEKYNAAVVIWCKRYGVQFSRAELQ